MTEKDKKKEAEGVEKRAISKITQMLARRLCLAAGYSERLIGEREGGLLSHLSYSRRSRFRILAKKKR